MSKKITWRKRLKPLFIFISLASLLWVAYMIWDTLPALKESVSQLDLHWLSFTLAGNIISGYIGFEAFRILFNKILPNTYSRKTLAHLYFVGQLMKHIPGRIWGLAYQTSTGSRASVAQWVGVSSVYMALNTAFALWVAATVTGFMLAWQYGIIALGIGLTLYYFGWRPYFLSAIKSYTEKKSLSVITQIIQSLYELSIASNAFKTHALLIFGASWIMYLSAWAGYGVAWPGLTALDGIWLCGIYTLAWFAGYISLLTPSGAGVRELVFIFLAKDFPPDAVAAMAILGRVILLGVDCILGGAFIPFGREKHE